MPKAYRVDPDLEDESRGSTVNKRHTLINMHRVVLFSTLARSTNAASSSDPRISVLPENNEVCVILRKYIPQFPPSTVDLTKNNLTDKLRIQERLLQNTNLEFSHYRRALLL
ncbi:unnamed protein product [Aspergillus oryzae]|uniref:Unnamed protein product n=2 Tax=Aspergillus oryzae TaxID=5062 RepID=A0AAN5BZZ5_ASPOZ|nr:unnamed protein product [Aspergillus oryzae]GMF90663.1 unnamed protein product [Aspergillus oryzae]GMG02729.1 unnamed protein product [Aspergillus oryzae]GMG33541.1 unnamed protein product [Aspergillus oryzae]GMG48493.1 unnamed protein product [Aspergillus oryzae var. brunneus]